MIKTKKIMNIEFSKVITLHASPQVRARYLKVQVGRKPVNVFGDTCTSQYSRC